MIAVKSGSPVVMTESQRKFAARAIRRKRLFLGLCILGVAVAAYLAAYYGWRRAYDPSYPLTLPSFVVVLVLLNARQNLRQYRYAGILEVLHK